MYVLLKWWLCMSVMVIMSIKWFHLSITCKLVSWTTADIDVTQWHRILRHFVLVQYCVTSVWLCTFSSTVALCLMWEKIEFDQNFSKPVWKFTFLIWTYLFWFTASLLVSQITLTACLYMWCKTACVRSVILFLATSWTESFLCFVDCRCQWMNGDYWQGCLSVNFSVYSPDEDEVWRRWWKLFLWQCAVGSCVCACVALPSTRCLSFLVWETSV